VISGALFNDADGDGLFAAGAGGFGGVAVELLNAAGEVIGTINTTGDGSFLFAGVPPGSYTVRVTPPEGLEATTATTITVSVPANGSANALIGLRVQEQPTAIGLYRFTARFQADGSVRRLSVRRSGADGSGAAQLLAGRGASQPPGRVRAGHTQPGAWRPLPAHHSLIELAAHMTCLGFRVRRVLIQWRHGNSAHASNALS
jgi:hypothetical protein